MRVLRRAAFAATVVLILLADLAHAQVIGRFRIDGQIAQSRRGAPVYSGYIYNNGGGGVGNVRLLVETLDAEGKVTGESQGVALGNMLARDRLFFEVPLQVTGASYRASVVSWDTFATGQ